MKRIAVVLLSFVMLVSSTACKSNTSTTGNHESAAENLQDSEKIQLTNQMTPTELKSVSKHELTLLDDASEAQTESAVTSEHKVCVEYYAADELRETLENNRSNMTEEECQKLEQLINGSEQLPLKYILVDDVLLLYPVPNSDPMTAAQLTLHSAMMVHKKISPLLILKNIWIGLGKTKSSMIILMRKLRMTYFV